MTTIYEHRARLNDAIAQDAEQAAKRGKPQAAKQAAWHRDQAAYLRQQDQWRHKPQAATW